MLFCPTCGNILVIEQDKALRYFCKTCPYVFNVNQIIKRVETFDDDKEEVDIIFDEQEAEKNAATMVANCPKCHHNRALYKEIQTRSADEPTTIFYKCKKCGYEWTG